MQADSRRSCALYHAPPRPVPCLVFDGPPRARPPLSWALRASTLLFTSLPTLLFVSAPRWPPSSHLSATLLCSGSPRLAQGSSLSHHGHRRHLLVVLVLQLLWRVVLPTLVVGHRSYLGLRLESTTVKDFFFSSGSPHMEGNSGDALSSIL
jgi:hypothetical protein